MDRSEQHGEPGWAPPADARPGATSEPSGGSDAATSGDSGQRTFGERLDDLIERIGFEDVEVPFETAPDAIRWWFGALADRRTWRSLVAAFAMSLIAPILFGLTVAVFAVTFALSIVVIGLLLVVPAFGVVAAFSGVGRSIAAWATDDAAIPERPYAPRRPGVFGPIAGRLTDETRWRQLAFVLLDVVVAPLVLAISFLPITALIGSVGTVDLDLSGGGVDLVGVGLDLGFGQVLLIIALLPAVARLLQLFARIRRRYVEILIGPDREQALVERVEELAVQRDQVLDAVAAERRRIERNLHDGVQQQLVALGIDIGRARNKLGEDPDAARELLDDARDKVRSSIGELRLIGRGLHPAVLEDRGLDAALSSIVASAPIPISVDVVPMVDPDGRPVEYSDDAAATAYYVANEAITNVLKYARARVASVRVEPDSGLLPAMRVTVHDDGLGGVDERRGSGVAGMRARVEAVDGAFRVDSPAGGPTVITAVIPIRRPRLDAASLDQTTDEPTSGTSTSERTTGARSENERATNDG